MTWCHRYPTAIRIEAIMYDLSGRLCGPRHTAHRLRVSLEDDVDLRRAHSIGGVRRVIARDRLEEYALGQPHPFLFGEFRRRHDLAARDASHVGDDGLYFGYAVI